MKSKRWYYFLPGGVYALGPSIAKSERAMREIILRSWYPGRKRLPRGVQVWKA